VRVGEERLGEDAGHPGHGVVARLRAELAAVRAHAADDDAARLPETGSGASALIGAEALSSGRRSSDRSVRG